MADESKPEVSGVELKPTWAGLMPALIAALQDGGARGRFIATEELMRLARCVDDMNAKNFDVPEGNDGI